MGYKEYAWMTGVAHPTPGGVLNPAAPGERSEAY